MTNLSVLIVAFRADDHLAQCLATLGQPGDVGVLVVDNGRSDRTRAIVEAGGATYLRSPGNVGFASAVNIGLDGLGASGDDVVLLNPDARIGIDALRRLQRALHDPRRRLAAVGPRLVDESGAEQAADWPVPSPGQVWADAVGLGGRWRGDRFVTGAVLLLRGDALRELGGLDERYFLYAEEADWQLRALNAGWEVGVERDVTAVHAGAASSSDGLLRIRHFQRSGRLLARKWYGRRGASVMWLGSLVAATRRSLIGTRAARAVGRNFLRLAIDPRTPGPVAASGGSPDIVHVVRSAGFAGVERYICDVATELARRGRQVTVIGGDPDRMRSELPRTVEFRTGATMLQVVRALWQVGHCQVVHAHMTAAELAAASLRRRNQARLVTTRHFAARRGRSTPARVAGRVVERQIDVQVAISNFVAARVEGPSVVILNAVTVIERAEQVRSDTVVTVQRLEVEKDTSTALRAWSLSGLGDRGWTLDLYGRGSQEAELQAECRKLGIGASVRFRGFVDDPRARVAAASVMLATAPAEPFGLAVLEAMAEATPVVAADGGAHRELLGPDGAYFSAGDAGDAATELVRFADSMELRRSIGERLRRRHLASFSVGAHVDALQRVYGPVDGSSLGHVGVVSLERWDDVWRRNQHLASRLISSGAASKLTFVGPPEQGFALRPRRWTPLPGVEAVVPPLRVPRRLPGGYRLLDRWVRRELADADVLWINDAAAGLGALRDGVPAVYDVTDDWRDLPQPRRELSRLVAAEDRLAARASTVACSEVLAQRWRERYGVDATVVRNGVDRNAIVSAEPRPLDGADPHAVYVGTLHPNRIDVSLICRLAANWPGTIHLVGPNGLAESDTHLLRSAGVRFAGPVPGPAVPGWLVSADVLICPHLVDHFTLSLDAVKAHEYLATDRPVVATASCGFQDEQQDGLAVVDAAGFVTAALDAIGSGPFARQGTADWGERTSAFAAVLAAGRFPREEAIGGGAGSMAEPYRRVVQGSD